MMEPHFFDFRGMAVAYYKLGHGRPLLLIHGSGPGASSLGNWRYVLEPLAKHFTVYAMDLIGFGRSDRKPVEPYFDFGMWVDQAQAMLDEMGEPSTSVIGHSLSGSIALHLAARDRRVDRLMTTSTVGLPFTPNDASWRTWTCPRSRDDLVATLRGLIHDPALITEEYLVTRERVLFQPGYADYFDAMFGGDKMAYIRQAELSLETLKAIACPVLLVHGMQDVGWPAEMSIGIHKELREADLYLLANCSHSVAFEHQEKFLALARMFLRT